MAIRHIDNTVDVKFRYRTPQGQKCENVFQFTYATPPSLANMTAFAAQLAAHWGLTLRGIYPVAVQFVEILVKDIHPLDGSGGQVVYTYPSGTNGLLSGDPAPSNAACRVELNTGLSGPSFSGAKSLSPFTEDYIGSDQLSNALIALIVNLALKWLVTQIVGGNTYVPAVGSNKLHKSQGISGFTIGDAWIDSQKTRLPTHGD